MTNPTTDGLARLSKLAEELFDAESDVVAKQAEVDAAKAKVASISERRIPELMDHLGLELFKTSSGLKVTVKTKLHARQLTQKHCAALQWLRDNGEGGLIKTIVGIPFTQGSESDADALVDQLAGEGFVATKEMKVNAASLSATLRSKMEEGVEVDLELMGGHQQRVAKVAAPK